MMLDHIGVELFPEMILLRIIGRIAFPIFAFYIYEGVKYTKNKVKYFLRVFILGLICMLAFGIYARQIYGNVLITFSLSILILSSMHYFRQNYNKGISKVLWAGFLCAASVGFAYFMCEIIYIDYGFFGVLLPVFADLFDFSALEKKPYKNYILLAGFLLGLIILSTQIKGIQFFSIASIPLLLCSKKNHSQSKLGGFFYIFYPAHLCIIGLVSMFI